MEKHCSYKYNSQCNIKLQVELGHSQSKLELGLQPNLKCLCPGGSAPARKPVHQENFQQVCMLYKMMNGFVNVNPPACLLEPQTAVPGSTNTNFKPQTPEQTHSCILTSHQQFNSGTLSSQELHQQWLYLSTCLQIYTDGLDGMTCLITIRNRDFSIIFL